MIKSRISKQKIKSQPCHLWMNIVEVQAMGSLKSLPQLAHSYLTLNQATKGEGPIQVLGS